jgi:hypothetical protein
MGIQHAAHAKPSEGNLTTASKKKVSVDAGVQFKLSETKLSAVYISNSLPLLMLATEKFFSFISSLMCL